MLDEMHFRRYLPQLEYEQVKISITNAIMWCGKILEKFDEPNSYNPQNAIIYKTAPEWKGTEPELLPRYPVDHPFKKRIFTRDQCNRGEHIKYLTGLSLLPDAEDYNIKTYNETGGTGSLLVERRKKGE